MASFHCSHCAHWQDRPKHRAREQQLLSYYKERCSVLHTCDLETVKASAFTPGHRKGARFSREQSRSELHGLWARFLSEAAAPLSQLPAEQDPLNRTDPAPTQWHPSSSPHLAPLPPTPTGGQPATAEAEL